MFRQQKSRPEGGLNVFRDQILLDLGFLELDVLLHDGIVLLEGELLGLGASVLLRDIEIARVSGRQELDLDHCGLGHSLQSLNGGRRGLRQKWCAWFGLDFDEPQKSKTFATQARNDKG